MRLHLRVAVRVEQARVIGCADVRDAESVPQDLGAPGRHRCAGRNRCPADAGEDERARQDESRDLQTMTEDPLHGVNPFPCPAGDSLSAMARPSLPGHATGV